MKEKLTGIINDALAQIESSDELSKLNDIRVAFLGKKGELTSVLKSMKDVAPEDRIETVPFRQLLQCLFYSSEKEKMKMTVVFIVIKKKYSGTKIKKANNRETIYG